MEGTKDWTYATQVFATADHAEGDLNFGIYVASGTAWLDDIRIVEGVFADTSLYVRRFSNALVIVRPS